MTTDQNAEHGMSQLNEETCDNDGTMESPPPSMEKEKTHFIYRHKKTGEVVVRGPSGMCSLTYELIDFDTIRTALEKTPPMSSVDEIKDRLNRALRRLQFAIFGMPQGDRLDDILDAGREVRASLELIEKAPPTRLPNGDGLVEMIQAEVHSDSFDTAMCSTASTKYGVGEKNRAFKDGASWCACWLLAAFKTSTKADKLTVGDETPPPAKGDEK
jgi:hypothetical protein